MSSLASGGGGLAGLSRVAFEATGVGETTRDIEQVRRVYRESSQDMSDSAIKVSLAQDRLERSLRKGPAAAREQANAELGLRRAERELRDETVRLDHAQDQAQRNLGKFSRGALAGSGIFRSLGRSVAFASAGFLGGAGLVAGISQAIDVASNLDEQTNKVGVTFRAAGADVVAWSRDSAKSFGIAQDQALEYAGTIGGIFNASGLARGESAKLSREIVELTADMASFNNASPQEAFEALRSGLVGESEPLRRFQVLLTEANVAQEAMRDTGKKSATELTQGEKVLARYHLILKQTGDQQGDFARTSDGLANSQRQLSALWRDTEALVGQAIIPTYKGAVQAARDWLAEDKNREELQRTINEVVGTGAKVSIDLAHAIEAVGDALRPVDKLLGGFDHTLELAFGVGLALKARKAVGSFGIIAASSRTTSTRMAADAAVAGRAWDVATRPRTLVVTETVAGGGTYVGSRGSTRGGGGLLGRLGGVVGTVAGIAAYGGLEFPNQQSADAYYRDRFQTWMRLAREGKLSDAAYAEIAPHLTDEQRRKLTNARIGGIGGYDEGRVPGRAPGAQAPPRRRGGGGGGGGPQRTMADILLDEARAATTPDNDVDDLRYHREARSLLQRQIANLENRKNLTAKQRERLKGLYEDLAREQGAIDAIIDDREAAAQKKREEAAARAKKRQEHADAWAKRTLDALDRRRKAQRDATDAFVKTRLHEKSPKDKTKSKGLSAADVERMQFDFLTRLTGEIGQWGSNFQPDSGGGQAATNSHLMVSLLRDQNAHIERLVAGAWHPGAQLAVAELGAAGWGVGY